MSEPVDEAEIRHVARLARIDLDDAEIDRFAGQFADILDHFETLDEVPHVEAETDLVNVLRPDEAVACLDRAAVLRNAPETEDGYFKGPRVS